MASTTIPYPSSSSASSSSHAAKKQLGELLQLQQEPFTLEIFLLERAHLMKKLNFERSSFLKSSSKWSFFKRRKPVPYCSKIVKEAVNKVLRIGNKQRRKDSPKGIGLRSVEDFGRGKQEKEEETEKFSSPTSPKDVELHGDREEDKQLSPVSVLEEQIHSKLSQFAVESVKKVPVAAPKQANSSPEPSQNLTTKRALQESKQLLFDCMKQLVEEGRRRQFAELMGADQVVIWSNLSGRETNTTCLLRYDFQELVPERWDYRMQRRDVGTEIAEEILDDMGREIVAHMFELDQSKKDYKLSDLIVEKVCV